MALMRILVRENIFISYGRKLMTNVFETREKNFRKHHRKKTEKQSQKWCYTFGIRKNTHSILETALASRTLH